MNEKMRSTAIVSGGSFVSTSFTPWSSTVTVHVSPTTKSVSGSSVYDAGAPESVNVWAPLVAHEIVNVAVDTLTGSLKVMETLESTGTSVALLAGAVLSTDGAASATEGVREKSSTASPSSAPEASKLIHRIQKLPPDATEIPEI